MSFALDDEPVASASAALRIVEVAFKLIAEFVALTEASVELLK